MGEDRSGHAVRGGEPLPGADSRARENRSGFGRGLENGLTILAAMVTLAAAAGGLVAAFFYFLPLILWIVGIGGA